MAFPHLNADLAQYVACRCCCCYYGSKDLVHKIFIAGVINPRVIDVLKQLADWGLEVIENDPLSQHICWKCVDDFERVFQLRSKCEWAYEDMRRIVEVRRRNLIAMQIKQEKNCNGEEKKNDNVQDFIFLDELSDDDEDIHPVAPLMQVKRETSLEDTLNCTDEPPEKTDATVKMLSEFNLEASTTPENPNLAEKRVNYLCQECDDHLINCTQSEIAIHLNLHEKDTEQIAYDSTSMISQQCEICRELVLTEDFNAHVEKHIQDINTQCPYCNEKFETEIAMEDHLWQIHNDDDVDNQEADKEDAAKVYDEVENNDDEELEMKTIGYKCAFCDFMARDISRLQVHNRDVHQGRVRADFVVKEEPVDSLSDNEMEQEGKANSSDELLSSNETTAPSDIFYYSEQSELDDLNSYEFTDQSTLAIHSLPSDLMTSGTSEDLQKSTTSDSIFLVPDTFPKKAKKTKKNRAKTIECDHCNKAFTTNFSLMRHRKKQHAV